MSWKCKQCGACCKFFSMPYVNLTCEIVDYLEMHGIAIDKSSKRLIIPARCEHLTHDNQCLIYKNRPIGCIRTGKWECAEARRRYAKITEKR